MKKKKPDQIVFDEKKEKYDAALRPYGTNSAAPAIHIDDTSAWKNIGIHKVNKQIETKYNELKEEYQKMIEKFEYNNLIYNARFNFEPVIGQTYHLYKDKNDEAFLSVIAPEECNFNFIGSFYLAADQLWEKC